MAPDLRGSKDSCVVRRLRPLGEKFALSCIPKISHARIRIQYKAAGQRVLFSGVANNKAIAGKKENRLFKTYLRDHSFARAQLFAGLEKNTRIEIGAAVVHPHCGAMFDRPRLHRQAPRARQHDVCNRTRFAEFTKRDNIAAPNTQSVLLARYGHIRQTQSRSRAGTDRFNFTIVILNRADPPGNLGRLNDHSLSAPERSTNKCASYDSSDAAQNERAINREARFAEIALGDEHAEFARELRFQFLDAAPGCDRCPNDCRISEWRIAELGADLFLGRVCRFNEVNFRERDDDAPHPEINQNLEMLFRLRHPSVVSRDNEQREIDRTDARDHVLDEIFVPRHVHDPDAEQYVRHSQFKLRKTHLDRDSAQLFFGEAIGIDTGERTHERALAVINMPGRREDEPLQFHCAAERRALTTCASCRGKMVRRSSLNFPTAT